MAIDIMIQKTSASCLKTFMDQDTHLLKAYPVNQPLQAHIKGIMKERAYKELCCYQGSCTYIANMDFSIAMNTHDKVDFMTKIRCGFIKESLYDVDMKQLHFIPKSLAYKNCDQPDAHKYIADALKRHADLVGLDVDDYIKLLDDQK